MKKKTKSYRIIKDEINNFIKKLHHFIIHRPDNISFERLKGRTCGFYDHETEEITIDYRKDIIPTLIHEFTHHLYPDWKEGRVEGYERKVMRFLTSVQSKNLIRLLAK